MLESAENAALLVEYEELLRYCPLLLIDQETAQSLDKYTLRILSSAARSNGEKRKELHCQKIQQAKARGVRFGRPKANVPANFPDIIAAWKKGEISGEEAIRQSGLRTATFYRYLKKLREQN